MFNEQQAVLRTFETDTARALSTADSRSHAFVDELRNQLLQGKTQEDGDRERVEQKMTQKLEEIKRSIEKYVIDDCFQKHCGFLRLDLFC